MSPAGPQPRPHSRPRVLVVLGRRGPGLDVTLAGVRAAGDVVCAATRDVARDRADAALLEALPPGDVVLADTDDALVEAVGRAGGLDGVFTVADDAVETTALVAARLGLRGLDPAAARVFRDKSRQRAALRAAGLRVPRWWSAQEALDEARLPYPLIVKPTKASGGALAFVVGTREELAEATAVGRAEAARHGAVDADTGFIVEELIRGRSPHPVAGFGAYVSVESASVGGARRHLGVTDRFPLRAPVLETGMCLPSTLADPGPVLATVDAALDALGLDEGMSHTEVMLTDDGPVVIEINARVGGALPYLFPMAAGVDLVETAAWCALGRPAPEVEFTTYAVLTVLQHPLGVQVCAEPDWSALAGVPGVAHVVPLTGPGHSTLDLTTTMAGLVLGTAATPEAVVAQHAQTLERFRPGYRTPAPTPAYWSRSPDGPAGPRIGPVGA